jgi:hypothetical protein
VHCGCAKRPFPAKRRPQFISVTVTSTLVQVCRVARNARFRRSVDRNLFRSPRGTRAVHCGCARRPFPAERRPQFISVTVTSTLVQVCRVARNARFRQSVDRNLFRSPRGTRAVHCGCARRPRPAERRPQFISVAAAEGRPQFISVAVSGARFWERSTLFNRFNLCENCYISVAARDARCALRVSKRPLPAERRPKLWRLRIKSALPR